MKLMNATALTIFDLIITSAVGIQEDCEELLIVVRRKTITKYRLTQQSAFLEEYTFC